MLLRTKDITESSKDPEIIGILTQEGLFGFKCNAGIERRIQDNLVKVMGGAGVKDEPSVDFIVTLKFKVKEATILPWSPKGDYALVIDWESMAPLSEGDEQ